MSSFTHEWHLKRENGIKYWVDIRDFNKKMNWRCGHEIYSRRFKISESVFSIFIYPNGVSATEKGHVSVYLCNNSSWRVRCSDITFKVKHHVKTWPGEYFQPGETKGFGAFLPHVQGVPVNPHAQGVQNMYDKGGRESKAPSYGQLSISPLLEEWN